VIDIGAIRQEHIGQGALVLVLTMSLEGDFLRVRHFWHHPLGQGQKPIMKRGVTSGVNSQEYTCH